MVKTKQNDEATGVLDENFSSVEGNQEQPDLNQSEVVETPEVVVETPEVVLGSNNPVAPGMVTPIAPPVLTDTVPIPKKSRAHEVSDLVYVRRRVREEVTYRYGEGINASDIQADELKYIGASFGKGKDTLRGVTPEEEKVYLPQIIGISANSPDWDKATKDYWLNIRKLVPAGNTGLELQIGFRYPSKEIALEAEQRYETTKNIRSRAKYGSPINVEDYLLYRYCLDYGKVANTFEEMAKSEKIEFYLYSKAKAVSDQYKALQIKQDAFTRYLQIIHDVEKKSAVLIRFGENVRHLTNQELDIKLDEMAKTKPRLFKEYADDPDLILKAVVEEAVIHQMLIKTPNTEILHYNNRILGNNLDEVVRALKSPEHSKDLLAIKTRVSFENRKRVTGVDDEDDAISEDY